MLVLMGCAAPKSTQHRAILRHQVDGYHIYKTENDLNYFVRCKDGLKYIGVHRRETDTVRGHYEITGPIDVCTGEEK